MVDRGTYIARIMVPKGVTLIHAISSCSISLAKSIQSTWNTERMSIDSSPGFQTAPLLIQARRICNRMPPLTCISPFARHCL